MVQKYENNKLFLLPKALKRDSIYVGAIVILALIEGN